MKASSAKLPEKARHKKKVESLSATRCRAKKIFAETALYTTTVESASELAI